MSVLIKIAWRKISFIMEIKILLTETQIDKMMFCDSLKKINDDIIEFIIWEILDWKR